MVPIIFPGVRTPAYIKLMTIAEMIMGRQKEVWKNERTPEPFEIREVRTSGRTITKGIM